MSRPFTPAPNDFTRQAADEHNPETPCECSCEGSCGGSFDPDLNKWVDKHIRKDDQELICCSNTPTRLVSAMTCYCWDGKGKNPNAPMVLCEDCAQEYASFWEEQWKEYYAMVMGGLSTW